MITIKHHKPEVVLKEEFYGNVPWESGVGAYSYYFKDKNGFEFITTRSQDYLIAVTKEQYNAWKSRTIIRVPVIQEIA